MEIANIDKQTAKRTYVMTDKRRAAIERMQQARKAKIAEKKQNKLIETPILKREESEDEKQHESSDKELNEPSSSETDSDNYESDKETKPVIISGYDDEKPDSKIKITRVRRKAQNDRSEELKRIYDDVKKDNKQQNKLNKRQKVLDAYYERNKDNFTSHDGELEEFEFNDSDEWDKMHARFSSYEKDLLKGTIKKAEPKKRKNKRT